MKKKTSQRQHLKIYITLVYNICKRIFKNDHLFVTEEHRNKNFLSIFMCCYPLLTIYGYYGR